MTTLADDLVPDELWALVAPLLPTPPRPPDGEWANAGVFDRLHLVVLAWS